MDLYLYTGNMASEGPQVFHKQARETIVCAVGRLHLVVPCGSLGGINGNRRTVQTLVSCVVVL